MVPFQLPSAGRVAEARLRDPDDPGAALVSLRQVDARNLRDSGGRTFNSAP